MSIQFFQPPPPRGGPVLQADGTFQLFWQRWFGTLVSTLNSNVSAGASGSVTLFGPHTNGSLTITDGVITGIVPPT